MNIILGNLSDWESHVVLVLLGCVSMFVVSVLKENGVDVYKSLQSKNIAIRWAAYYAMLILIIISFSFSAGDTGFMYAQY